MTGDQLLLIVVGGLIGVIPSTLVFISARRTGKHQDIFTDTTTFGLLQQQLSTAFKDIGGLRAELNTERSERGVLQKTVENQARRIRLYERQRTDDQAEIHSLKKQVDDLPKTVEALRQQLRDHNILPKEDPHADAAIQAIEKAARETAAPAPPKTQIE